MHNVLKLLCVVKLASDISDVNKDSDPSSTSTATEHTVVKRDNSCSIDL